MKYLFLIMALIISNGVKAQVNYDYIASTDTLTNADTISVTLGRTYNATGYVQCGVTITNISGTSAGRGQIQVAHSPSGSNWITNGTDTIALTTATNGMLTATFHASRARIRYISTGTQSTQLVTGCSYRRGSY